MQRMGALVYELGADEPPCTPLATPLVLTNQNALISGQDSSMHKLHVSLVYDRLFKSSVLMGQHTIQSAFLLHYK